MKDKYAEYISNLINSVTQNLLIGKAEVMLIRHYNSLDLKQDIAEKSFVNNNGIRYVYHEFDGSVMANAYEPFLSCIKDIYYEKYDISVDEFLEKCGVYHLHRSVIKSFFETGICKRADEVLISEIKYEGRMMERSIDNMLEYISLDEKIVFVFNRINNASESTIRILRGMLGNKKYNNISVMSTYNEMSRMPEHIEELWEEYIDYLSREDCIVEWNFNEEQMISDFRGNFVFSLEKMPEYLEKLYNMYHLLAIRQAEYYLNIIYKKIEVEKLDISQEYAFSFMELYTEIALMLDNNSDAMIYAEAMKSIITPDDKEMEFRNRYIWSKIYMLSGLNEEAKKMAMECYDIANEQGNEFDMFRAELAHFVAVYSGWKETLFLDRHSEVPSILLENAKKYGYYNQLAHIYVFAFDNTADKFNDIDKLEENLEYFYKGINLAKSMGNERLLIEGYKKNIMLASTNGLLDVCNYYYILLTKVELIKNNEFEIANIYNGQGYNNCAAEKFDKANEYYNKALIIFDKLNEPEYVGETLYNIAINAMLASEYKLASECLEVCLSIVKILKIDSLRICNISKLFGLLALCYYRMGVMYSCKLTLQSSLQYLDHLYTTDVNAKRDSAFYLWDDDLFLCHYNNALMLMEDGKYEQSLDEFKNAQKYMEVSTGFLFFSATQFCMDKAILYRHMGENEKAENIINECIKFCEEKGYVSKLEMLYRFIGKTENKPSVWNLSLEGITLLQVESNVKSLAVQYSYKRQKHNMEFLSVWQKTADNFDDTLEKLIETSIGTFKNYFNMDYVLFIRFEKGIPVIKHTDGAIDKEKLNYVVDFFKNNRTEVITSRTEINYYEYKELIDNVLYCDRINSVIFAPIYKNENLDSIFITYSILKDSWNSLNSKIAYDKDELPIFMFFFRELLATIERIEDKQEIKQINFKLQKANARLSQLAVTDMLTGLLNRQGLSEQMDQYYCMNAKTNKKNEFAIMYADLDNFKYYNDTYGHDIGDIVLCGFANIIDKICTDNKGFAVRYGGDEFLMIINSSDKDEIDKMAQSIYCSIDEKEGFEPEVCKALGENVNVPMNRRLSVSVGIYLLPEVNLHELRKSMYEAISYADKVLYYIKRTEKSRYLFYDEVKEML
ncbi:MAG: GGDEF domain-containing protein [Lachnospiraceae bacterium]|nr:GGDEF domain-containing protein [Lachnospiraceae bacterium]